VYQKNEGTERNKDMLVTEVMRIPKLKTKDPHNSLFPHILQMKYFTFIQYIWITMQS